MIMTKKYFSTIEGEDYDKVKYEVKNGVLHKFVRDIVC